jgi:hypothetical protein
MELWLLVGALVLIALTVWIVWSPQRPRDAEELPVNDVNGSTIPPQGDKFEDQYTSATADLSAGGVATAREVGGNVSSAVTPQVERAGDAASTAAKNASEAWSSATSSTTQPWSAGGTMNVDSTDGQRGMLSDRRTMGVGATALVALAGGVGGAMLYQRWQRKRTTRIQRLRRGALGLAGRLNERLPETDLPIGTAPLGGAGAAVLLSSLLVARALRRSEPPTVQARVEQSRGIVGAAVEFGRQEAFKRLQVVILAKALEEARKRGKDLPVAQVPQETAKRGGMGVGGILLIGGIAFVIVRMLRGGRGAQHAPAM